MLVNRFSPGELLASLGEESQFVVARGNCTQRDQYVGTRFIASWPQFNVGRAWMARWSTNRCEIDRVLATVQCGPRWTR